jgi:LPS export ABC transporter protein LptC
MTYVVSDGSRNEIVVEAATAEVKPAEDEAQLHEVRARMGSKAPQGVPGGGMEMRCDRGIFDLETRDFVATGNVRGVTSDGRRFRTERLRYRARDGLVWSESAVVLRDSGAVLEGTGFEYRVRQDRFKLRDARIRQEGS